MIHLEEIVAATGSFPSIFWKRYNRTLYSDDPIIQEALAHLKNSQGKHIRPLLMALTIKLLGKDITDELIDSAILIELLHSASLIHDDVIDLSTLRRGKPTLNSIYGNHISVLVGDFILARCFNYAVMHCPKNVLEVVSEAGMFLSMGEIYQLRASESNQIIAEEEYFKIIKRKTATLFSASTFIASLIAKANSEVTASLTKLGQLIGFAFQIKDDLFDYYPKVDIGKPSGLDLLEGKVTLPLIYVYKNSSEKEKIELTSLIKKAPKEEAIRNHLVKIAIDKGGVEATQKKLESILKEAEVILSFFIDSEAKIALSKLVDFLYFRSY